MLITIQAVEERRNHVDLMCHTLLPHKPVVHYDKLRKSPLNAFYNMLDIQQYQNEYRLHMQDDVIFNNRLVRYLPYVLKDMKERDMHVLTLFTPNRKLPKEQLSKGLKYGVFPNYLWLQATIFSTKFINIMREVRDEKGEYTKHDDVFVQDCLKRSKIQAYCHLPSIVQHHIKLGSVVGNANSKRRMSDIYDTNYITNYLENEA